MMPANRRMDEAWTIALVWLQGGKHEKWKNYDTIFMRTRQSFYSKQLESSELTKLEKVKM